MLQCRYCERPQALFFGYGQGATGGTSGFYRNASNGVVEFRTQNFANAHTGVKLRNAGNRFYVSDSSSNGLFSVLHGGNVGVGTITPNEKFTVVGSISATGTVQPSNYKSSDGSSGATGTFTTADAKTVTVKNGIITSIV